MSDRPTTRAWMHRDMIVAVETGKGTGVFVRDPRLTVQSVLIGSDDRVSEAVVNCWAGPTTPSAGGEDALSVADVFERKPRSALSNSPFVGPDQRIYIYRNLELEDDQSSAPIAPLFQGFASQIRHIESGGGSRCTRSFSLPVEGVLSRVSDLYGTQLIGRVMRSNDSYADLAEEDPTPDAFGSYEDAKFIKGYPAVFNPGRGNRAAVPMTVEVGDRSVVVSVFTHDKDDDAKYWTWAQVWRYLLVWYLYENVADGTGLVIDGNVFDETDELQALEHTDQATPPVASADALRYAMLGRPSGFSIDRLNVVEAMVAAAAEMGCHFCVRTEISDEADPTAIPPKPQDKLYVWARGAGTTIDLHRETLPAGTDARTVLEKNDARDLEIGVDYRDIVPKPYVYGDVRRYEITTELVPGWKPDDNLDDVADLPVAHEYARAHLDEEEEADLVADPWYKRYHRSGSEHHLYRHVGRRWIMNASGKYKASDYARTTGPYTADAYKPWEPTRCDITNTEIGDDGTVQTVAVAEGAWTHRPRPFSECFSATFDRRSLGIVVDISFNGGLTYHRMPSGLTVRALADEDGIVIETDDLTQLFPPGEHAAGAIDGSFWDALLNNDLRLFVTAVIEGTSRIEAKINPAAWSPPTDADVTRQFDLSGTMKSNRRDGANSIFAPGGQDAVEYQTLECRDDLLDLQRKAQEILTQCSTRQIPGLIYVPWPTDDYQPGQSLRSIKGMGVNFNTIAAQTQTRYPDLVGVEHLPGGVRLVIEDWRVLDKMGRKATVAAEAGSDEAMALLAAKNYGREAV